MHSSDHPQQRRDQTQLFADISRMTGMPFPNLLYRRLAGHPGQLEACWDRVGPGLRLVGAPALRHRLVGPGPGPAVNGRAAPLEDSACCLTSSMSTMPATPATQWPSTSC